MASHMLFKSPTGEVVRVKIGFSWQAFFIGSLRAVVRRTWLVFGVLAIAYFMFAWMGSAFLASSSTIALLLLLLAVYFGYMVFCGVYGNRWLVSSLLRRGFRQVPEDKR
ncbi:MAG TPA: hypothetical protein VF319_02965 [Caldimonas sp.]